MSEEVCAVEDGSALAEWRHIAWRLSVELTIAKKLLSLNMNTAREIFLGEVDRVLDEYMKLEKEPRPEGGKEGR